MPSAHFDYISGRATIGFVKEKPLPFLTNINLIASGCGAVGSARALGARCRRFKSCHSDQKAELKSSAFSFGGAGFEPVYLLCKYGSSFLKHSRNARSAQPRFISPCFSYLLEKTVINCFFFGDLSLRPKGRAEKLCFFFWWSGIRLCVFALQIRFFLPET